MHTSNFRTYSWHFLYVRIFVCTDICTDRLQTKFNRNLFQVCVVWTHYNGYCTRRPASVPFQLFSLVLLDHDWKVSDEFVVGVEGEVWRKMSCEKFFSKLNDFQESNYYSLKFEDKKPSKHIETVLCYNIV